jgi:SagB-type dehydrogenase family enzyme
MPPRISIAQYYHERTKYDPETISAKSQGLDWSTQPSPYKDYRSGKSFDLKPYLAEAVQVETDGLLSRQWQRLSKLLFCSYGLTARVPTMTGESLYLRSTPSAGGLYPAELYLISKGTPLLPPGLYNYQSRNHSLIHFWENSSVWATLQTACGNHPALEKAQIAIATTAIFFRSAWRYQDRAYRRIYLDTGHLLGNIELACNLNNFCPYLIGGFIDTAMNDLLYLDNDQEGVTTVIPIVDEQDIERVTIPTSIALSSPTKTDYPRIPDGQLLSYFHQATQIEALTASSQNLVDKGETARNAVDDKYNFPFCTKVSTTTEPIYWEAQLEELESTILKRRSTRAYSGSALSLSELKSVLDFTYQPQHYAEQGLNGAPDYFDLSLIETFVAVSNVGNLEEGCYYYAPKAQELRQIRFKNFRRELHYLCLGQDLGRDAGAVVFHTADLAKAVVKYGDRAYRYLHMDAGHLGQRLNLAAIQLGLGVSGIGGFFDDQVNEVLGIPIDEAVLYITTLGRPR